MEEIKLGIYRHFKGNLYRVIQVAYHHQVPRMIAVVIYHKCSETGVFLSIRKMVGDEEVIIPQPFFRDVKEFTGKVDKNENFAEQPEELVPRFTLIKEM